MSIFIYQYTALLSTVAVITIVITHIHGDELWECGADEDEAGRQDERALLVPSLASFCTILASERCICCYYYRVVIIIIISRFPRLSFLLTSYLLFPSQKNYSVHKVNSVITVVILIHTEERHFGMTPNMFQIGAPFSSLLPFIRVIALPFFSVPPAAFFVLPFPVSRSVRCRAL